jgi:tRNA(Ile)-lysidine synthase TilS/MesJ
MALAKMLKEDYGVREVALYVSHGLFSFGWEHLKEHIDQVYCYFSWLDNSQLATTSGYIVAKEYYQ